MVGGVTVQKRLMGYEYFNERKMSATMLTTSLSPSQRLAPPLDWRNPAFGNGTIHRVTPGFNIGLPGGSLFMINYERWEPKGAHAVDVFGVRWAVSL